MAKHGLVAMTRAFLSSKPTVFESEGIKCYALCPSFADTHFVRSAFENEKGFKENHGIVTSKGRVHSMKELAETTKSRVLTVNEVGDAMIKSLEYDKVRP